MTQLTEDDVRRKKALYRANHRGTKEMDLILGSFAHAEVANLSDKELVLFEALLAAPDPEMLKWFMGQAEVPREYDTPLFNRIKNALGQNAS